MGLISAFGSAHSAALFQDISPPTKMGPLGSHIAGALASFMEHFDGHFGALSASASGSTVVMESLAAATTTQYNKILDSMAELKMLSIAASVTTCGSTRESATGCPPPEEDTKANLHTNQLMSAIKVKRVPGRLWFMNVHSSVCGHHCVFVNQYHHV